LRNLAERLLLLDFRSRRDGVVRVPGGLIVDQHMDLAFARGFGIAWACSVAAGEWFLLMTWTPARGTGLHDPLWSAKVLVMVATASASLVSICSSEA